MAEVTFEDKLQNVISALKAPKGNFNSFGRYNYRSCEDVLEALKPLLNINKLRVNLSDEVVQIGDRYYVKATARVTDGEKTEEATAYARESEDKKGMDDSQITGSTSSYARKYALNGLFCIDDNKDADTDEQHNQVVNAPEPTEPRKPTEKQIAMIRSLCSQLGHPQTITEGRIKGLKTSLEASEAIKKLQDQLAAKTE